MDYILKRSKRRSLSVQIENGNVLVRAPMRTPKIKIDLFVKKYEKEINKMLRQYEEREKAADAAGALSEDDITRLKKEAMRYIPERTEAYAKIIGVTYGNISVRCQKTRWGSCSAKGNLNFNCLLMLAPPEVIDSVIVHELCHRKHMDHSKRFYGEVYKAYPEYDKWNKWLKTNGKILLLRAGK